MASPRPAAARPAGLLEFAETLAELDLVPPLSEPQGRYLAALDGSARPLDGTERTATARAAGRRYLQTLIAAHTIAGGYTARVAAIDRDARGVRDDVVRLAVAYLNATGVDRTTREIDALLTVRTTKSSPKGDPTCPDASAPFASPAPPSKTPSSATTAAP